MQDLQVYTHYMLTFTSLFSCIIFISYYVCIVFLYYIVEGYFTVVVLVFFQTSTGLRPFSFGPFGAPY